MSTGNKILIGCGAAIVVLIMVVGAFSLGVYVGHGGLAQGPPTIASTNRLAEPKKQSGAPGGTGGPQPVSPQALPQGRPDLIGTVDSLVAGSLTVRTPDGSRLVQIGEDVEIQLPDGRQIETDKLRRGVPVAIYGERTNGGHTMQADLIVVLPPK